MTHFKLKHFFLTAALTTGIAASTTGSVFANTESNHDQMSLFALGPGITNLSLGDKFATYQWALKNDGEFQLTQLTKNFTKAKMVQKNPIAKDGTLHFPGPDSVEVSTRNAVTGIDINMLNAWNTYDQSTTEKRSVTVAIIDTGIDFSHADLQNCAWTNPGEIEGDGIDNDGNGFIDDIHGWNFYADNNQIFTGNEDTHGTHGAGTIGASRGSFGIAGITDNNYVKIMSVKALGGDEGSGTAQDVVDAIHYAEANGASICNLSFGTTVYSQELDDAIKNSKMLFVIAAGNGDSAGNGYSIDFSPIYPAALPYDNIITVGNLLFDGKLSSSSNFGSLSVDICAPGAYILSTVPGNKYSFYSGTSMAAPMVTGVAAMLYSYRPELSLSDLKPILLNSSTKLDGLAVKTVSGGMVNAYGALTYQ